MVALESDRVGETREARRARREREREDKIARSPEARAKIKKDKAKRAAADAGSGKKKRKKADKAAASPEVTSDTGAHPEATAIELFFKNPKQQLSSPSRLLALLVKQVRRLMKRTSRRSRHWRKPTEQCSPCI